MEGGVARDFLNAIDGFPVLPPPFVVTFLGPINRSRIPLPASWVSVYGVILPIFCRVALPNEAQWFVDLCWEGGTWCLGRGWESFSVHAGFHLGDDLLFAYQSDGLFIVSRIENGPPLELFNEPDIALADVQGLDPLPDMQQLFAEWDAAAAAMANAAHMQLPPGNIFELVDHAEELADVEQPPADNDDNDDGLFGHEEPAPAEAGFSFRLGRNEWDVVVKSDKERVRVRTGFLDMVRAQNIKVGNILRFELQRGRNNLFVVSIKR